MKNVLIILFLTSYMNIYAQTLPKELTDLNSAKKFFSEHILELDPVEGIYDSENVVEVGVSSYGQTIKQHFTWIILDIKKLKSRLNSDYDFLVYSANGDVIGLTGVINTISEGSYYTLKSANANGDFLSFRFQLENNIAFKITDNTHYGNASRLIVTTAIKSFPTVKMYQDAINSETQKRATSSGTGVIISPNGYIVTNNHVIENAINGNIKVTGINNDYQKMYKAHIEVTDKQNDLALLKIVDSSLNIQIPYTFKFNTANVGEDCFVLGYPLISSMGKEIKLTTGVISSKTGFEGNIAQYQISAPVQPGNSGGPLFDKNGNIIGIVQAKHTTAENAGYAIKASYIRNLVELLPISIDFSQTNNRLAGKTLPQQVELASRTICLIIVNDYD